MNIRNRFSSQVWITIWHYLKQPLFDPETHIILNPLKFAQLEKIQFLERCWDLDHPLSTHG